MTLTLSKLTQLNTITFKHLCIIIAFRIGNMELTRPEHFTPQRTFNSDQVYVFMFVIMFIGQATCQNSGFSMAYNSMIHIFMNKSLMTHTLD